VSFSAYTTCKSWFAPVAHAEGTFASYQHIASIVSGSFAGLCATVSTYPLDLLRTRFAAQQQHQVYRGLLHAGMHIVEREGIGGLYTGMTPTLIGIVPLMAIQFGSYEAFKQAIKNAKAEPGVDPNTLTLSFMEQVRESDRSSRIAWHFCDVAALTCPLCPFSQPRVRVPVSRAPLASLLAASPNF